MSGRYTSGLEEHSAVDHKDPEQVLMEKQARSSWEDLDELEPVDDEEAFRRKLKAVDGLTTRKAEVLVKRLVLGLSFKDIAQALGYKEAKHAWRSYKDAVAIIKRKLE